MSRTKLKKLELPYESVKTLLASSEVHLCRNELSGELQVTKSIDMLGLEEAVALTEATLLLKIKHPQVLRVIDIARDKSWPEPMKVVSMIMPYCPRGSVFDSIERGEQFTFANAIQGVSAGLRGLAEIHETWGVLHRDVKPPNLFLDERGPGLIVGDLGLAIPMGADGTAEAFPTSHLWTPPEVYATRRVSRASDLYGMGMTLFEMVNGPFPYGTYSTTAIIARLQRNKQAVVPKHLAFKAHVPKRMRTVIRKATAVDPLARFQTAREMEEALARLRFINWELIEDSLERRLWQGFCVQRPDRSYRVDFQKRKRGWSVSGLQKIRRWQRVVDDQIVTGPDDDTAASLFEKIEADALKR